MRTRLLALVAASTLLWATSLALAAKCGEAPGDLAAVEAARDAVRAGCDCEVASRAAYMGCVGGVIADRVDGGELPKSCRGAVRQFASRSTCGRADVVACCLKKGDRPWKGVIRPVTKGCVAPKNGQACETELPHLADGCSPEDGCTVDDCGNGTVDPGEDCEPPGSFSCDDQCNDRCGNGVVEITFGEQCDPPGTATCDASCQQIHTCGDGVIEPPAEECEGQSGCGPDCTLARSVCCDLPSSEDQCIGWTVYDGGMVYHPYISGCIVAAYGTPSFGVCEGPPCSGGLPGCKESACEDQAIDPLPVCCQQHEGGCRDTVLTSTGDFGDFDCGVYPDDFGDTIVVGTCESGSCVPAE